MIAIMVHHMTKRQLVGITPADTVPDDIEMELAAMDAVGTAIGELHDADARQRILRWAMERFDPHSARTPKNSLMPQAARADLDDVSVDNLDGLFDNDAPVVKMGPRPVENLDRLFENDASVGNFDLESVANRDRLFENDALVVNCGPRSVGDLDGLFESYAAAVKIGPRSVEDRKSTRLNSSHTVNSYAVFCLKKKNFHLRAGRSLGHRRVPVRLVQ